MVHPFTIDAASGLASVSMGRTVKGTDIDETLRALYQHADWRQGFSTLWDALSLTSLCLEFDDLPRLVATQREFSAVAGPGRDVLVVRRPIDRAMAEMYATMARACGRTTHVCRTREEAAQILFS